MDETSGALGPGAAGKSSMPAAPRADAGRSRVLRWEVGIVLALSLGKSAVFSLLSLANSLSEGPLSRQSVTLNSAYSANPVIETLYQLSVILFSLAPVALVVFLLSRERPGEGITTAVLPRLGLSLSPRRPAGDVVVGLGLFALVGLATIGLYLGGRAAGVTAQIVPSTLEASLGNQVILSLSAVRHGLLEEVIVLGYLFWRSRELGVRPWAVIVLSAVLRGLYHSYQGFGPMAGNMAMGLLFGCLYSRTGRLFPMIIAHVCLDLTAFLAARWFASL